MTHGVPLRKLQDMQQRSITKPCLRGQISTRSLILWLIIDLHWRQTILWTMTRGHFLGNRALIFTQPPAEEQQAVSCQRAPLSELVFRSLAVTQKGDPKAPVPLLTSALVISELLGRGCRPAAGRVDTWLLRYSLRRSRSR